MPSIIDELLNPIRIPNMIRVRQEFPIKRITDVSGEVRRQVSCGSLLSRVKPGQTVAITAGSRGLADLPSIIREVVALLKSVGAIPFIVPAMGSHGGATAEGQIAMLAGMGITEETVCAPIRATMETVQVGVTKSGLPAYIDKYASEADAIVVINRIKPHVAFTGPYESGLMKMITIGLGKQKGADTCHNLGFGKMAENIPAIANVVLESANIIFGIGILENAYDQVRRIVALSSERIPIDEPNLLLEAKSYVPRLPFEQFEVLVIDEIGKDISGTGLDTKVVGRYHTPYADDGLGPVISRVGVLDLTEPSHGNANGIGLADYTTRRLFNKMDMEQTYANSLTSTVPLSVKIPMVLGSDQQVFQACIKCSNVMDKHRVRVVRIKNTRDLDYLFVSENMREEILQNPQLEIISETSGLPFDKSGNLLP
jgi:hypothetical protein